jgi:hypothetical protein
MTRTIVALYDDFDVARDVVEDLVEDGFSRDKLSLVANDASGEYSKYVSTSDAEYVTEDVSAGEGAGFGAVVGTLVGLGAMAIPGIGPVIAAGPLVSALVGATVGATAGAITGGLVAGLVDMGVPDYEAPYYAEGVRRGGTLVVAHVDDNMVENVVSVMERHNPVNIDRRASDWRQSGWTDFDSTAQPYSTTDLNRERETYRSQSASSSTGSTYDTAREGSSRSSVASYTTTGKTFDAYDPEFRKHWEMRYNNTGYGYDYYLPAYRYGYTMALDDRYRNYSDWSLLEPEARRTWESRNINYAWEDFKDAVHEAWTRVKNAF